MDCSGVGLRWPLVRDWSRNSCTWRSDDELHQRLARRQSEVSRGRRVGCVYHRRSEILARLRAGDESACEAFVRQHAGHMLAVARRFLRTEEDSADAVQDAFLSAFRSLDGFEGHSALGTWLHRIVVNVCLMRLRARSRNREVRIDDLLPTFDETGHHHREIRPWDDQALARLTESETRAQVRACIERLPTPYREVLLLRELRNSTPTRRPSTWASASEPLRHG